VYDLIIANKKVFLRNCVKRFEVHKLYTYRATTGGQQRIFELYGKTNPNFGDALLCIERALHEMYIATEILYGTGGRLSKGGMDEEELVDLYEKLHKRFWDTIIRWHETAVGSKRKLEYNSTTDDIRELLARGWVHQDDLTPGEGGLYVIHKPTNLCSPYVICSVEEANDIASKFGVPTTTIIS
jgi:hypothetical protein